MVRREDLAKEIAEATAEAKACCTFPAGESPAPASTGAPGSRTQPRSEMGEAERVMSPRRPMHSVLQVRIGRWDSPG